MRCSTHPLGSFDTYKYVVVLSGYEGRHVLVRQHHCTTWEAPGGKIDGGETPLEAARRELYEETGALEADLTPLVDYTASDDSSSANGVVFLAIIHSLGDLPAYEMAELRTFDEIPTNLTYPDIMRVLYIAAKASPTWVSRTRIPAHETGYG